MITEHEKAPLGGEETTITNGRSDSTRSAVSDMEIDPAAERRLVRKLDLIIVPTFFIIYMMSFLDRINISNARIQEMPKDLDLSGKRFNVALLVRIHTQRTKHD
jgi:hypothetical protein